MAYRIAFRKKNPKTGKPGTLLEELRLPGSDRDAHVKHAQKLVDNGYLRPGTVCVVEPVPAKAKRKNPCGSTKRKAASRKRNSAKAEPTKTITVSGKRYAHCGNSRSKEAAQKSVERERANGWLARKRKFGSVWGIYRRRPTGRRRNAGVGTRVGGRAPGSVVSNPRKRNGFYKYRGVRVYHTAGVHKVTAPSGQRYKFKNKKDAKAFIDSLKG